MSMTDPIADMLTRLRNASRRRSDTVTMPSSKQKIELARVLKQEGFIKNYVFSESDSKQSLSIDLLYFGKISAIQGIERLSKPGRRLYVPQDKLRRFHRGNDTIIVTTAKGVLTDKNASAESVGGEVICRVW